MPKDEKKTTDFEVVVVNKKARFEYEILEVFEAGIALTGNEIKSIRAGGISLAESYVRPQRGEVWLLGAHIKEYNFSHDSNYDPMRERKLLLHGREIHKLQTKVEAKGLTVVPLRVYLKRGKAKLEIALARGKHLYDKRESIIAREKDREAARAMKGQR